jgi:hypothetical protein
MLKYQRIRLFRNENKKSNKIHLSIPQRYLETDNNNSIKSKKRSIHSYDNLQFNAVKIKDFSKDIIPKNLASLTYYNKNENNNKNDTHQNYLYNTFQEQNNFFLTFKNKKFLKLKNNNKPQHPRNTLEKITIKTINSEFKPDTERLLPNNKIKIKKTKYARKINYSTDYKKTIPTISHLIYYYPNLYNFPYNKKMLPKLGSYESKILFKNLKDLNYNDQVRKLRLIKKNNTNNDSFIKTNEPLFIEETLTCDLLDKIRFNFKNSTEKEKFRHYLKSFNTTVNLKFNKC